jgi:hypothetical protein
MQVRAKPQRGQALIAGLVLVLLGTAGMFWWFNTTQVVHSRQRLETASDAAAYSAAVQRARVLNYIAYSNRAIVAQEVAIAQAVTLASWSTYFAQLLNTGGTTLAALYPPAAPFVATAQSVADTARDIANQAAELEIWSRGADGVGYKNLLALSQEAMLASAQVFGLGAVANEVARANDARFFAFVMPDAGEFANLTKRYESVAEKQGLRDLVFASLDEFVKGPRLLDLRLLLVPSGCFGTSSFGNWFQVLRKRGGTELSADHERWEAADTMSLHNFRRRGWFFGSCREFEQAALGWGGAEAADQELTQSLQGNPGDTWRNAAASQAASAEMPRHSFNGYSGLTVVRDLNYDALGQAGWPAPRVAVLARSEQADLRSANQLNIGVGRLRQRENLPGRRLWSVSSAEVVFQKPVDLLGVPNELPSLYAPWWQARLAAPSIAERASAQAYASR